MIVFYFVTLIILENRLRALFLGIGCAGSNLLKFSMWLCLTFPQSPQTAVTYFSVDGAQHSIARSWLPTQPGLSESGGMRHNRRKRRWSARLFSMSKVIWMHQATTRVECRLQGTTLKVSRMSFTTNSSKSTVPNTSHSVTSASHSKKTSQASTPFYCGKRLPVPKLPQVTNLPGS